jgi:hypothetical protein
MVVFWIASAINVAGSLQSVHNDVLLRKFSLWRMPSQSVHSLESRLVEGIEHESIA